MYTVDYFIKKFSAIPEENWCMDTYDQGLDTHCAIGHCGVDISKTRIEFSNEAKELVKVLALYDACAVFDINDGKDPRYQQPTPKQRILAALHDIKKLQGSGKPSPVHENFQSISLTKVLEKETPLIGVN